MRGRPGRGFVAPAFVGSESNVGYYFTAALGFSGKSTPTIWTVESLLQPSSMYQKTGPLEHPPTGSIVAKEGRAMTKEQGAYG